MEGEGRERERERERMSPAPLPHLYRRGEDEVLYRGVHLWQVWDLRSTALVVGRQTRSAVQGCGWESSERVRE